MCLFRLNTPYRVFIGILPALDARINAGARICGTNYSNLIHGLKVAGVDVNRKVLADLAISDMNAFNQLVQVANKALNA